MKVLYIDVNCKNSSTGQIVYSLFSQCKKNGIEAAVCYGRGPKIIEEGIYKFGFDWETRLHALLTRITGYTGCFSFFSTRRLIEYIKAFKPDVVHIHELHAYFVNLKPLLKFLRKENIRTIFSNHCEFLYTGKCGYSGSCKRYQDKCGHCPKKKDYPKSLFFDCTKYMLRQKKKLFDGWDNIALTSPSYWLKNRMSHSFFNNRDIKVINNGIDTESFNNSIPNLKVSLNIPNDYKVVLTAAPNLFSDIKGGYRFLRIAKELIKEKIMCIAIGENGEDIELHEGLKIIPTINDKEKLIDYYSIADCFVICSKDENYPTTSIEAQCCGTKVVGFDVGGVSETIIKGNGCVVPFDDTDSTIKAIKNIINSGYSKELVSKKSREYFSEQRMFNDYLQLYNE